VCTFDFSSGSFSYVIVSNHVINCKEERRRFSTESGTIKIFFDCCFKQNNYEWIMRNEWIIVCFSQNKNIFKRRCDDLFYINYHVHCFKPNSTS
jgi:hypothetical protein